MEDRIEALETECAALEAQRDEDRGRIWDLEMELQGAEIEIKELKEALAVAQATIEQYEAPGLRFKP